MKKRYVILAVSLLLFFVIAFVYSIIYFHKAYMTTSLSKSGLVENTKKWEYHFAIIAQNTDDPFWQSVRKGAFDAAKEFNVAVEFNGPRFASVDEQLQYIDIAIASRVDGIATHVLDERLVTPLIDKAVNSNIPVVTVESDARNSKRQSFVGITNFQLGFEGGKLITEAKDGKAQVAVILNNYSDEGENVMHNLKVQGFLDAVKASPGVEIKTVQTSKMGIFSAEEVTQDILNKYPDVDAIFCTSSKDTLGAAQIVVDFNRVGDITIIGYDDLHEILRYVEKGVVYGTVVSDPVNIGYESIKALYEIKKKNRTSAYVDTGVHVVTRKNLEEYKKILDKKKGQELYK